MVAPSTTRNTRRTSNDEHSILGRARRGLLLVPPTPEGGVMSVQALLAARGKAFEHSGGKIGPAAAHLAEQIEFDEQLRNAAATVLIALLFEPGFGEHRRIFELDTKQTLDAFVEHHCPRDSGDRDTDLSSRPWRGAGPGKGEGS